MVKTVEIPKEVYDRVLAELKSIESGLQAVKEELKQFK